jgi:hypothetical protein
MSLSSKWSLNRFAIPQGNPGCPKRSPGRTVSPIFSFCGGVTMMGCILGRPSGHVFASQIREAILGDRIESLHPQELDKMKALVEQAMQAGAFGLPPLEQAIRKITSLPAQRERLRDRCLLKEGYFADVTIFDPMIQ